MESKKWFQLTKEDTVIVMELEQSNDTAQGSQSFQINLRHDVHKDDDFDQLDDFIEHYIRPVFSAERLAVLSIPRDVPSKPGKRQKAEQSPVRKEGLVQKARLCAGLILFLRHHPAIWTDRSYQHHADQLHMRTAALLFLNCLLRLTTLWESLLVILRSLPQTSVVNLEVLPAVIIMCRGLDFAAGPVVSDDDMPLVSLA